MIPLKAPRTIAEVMDCHANRDFGISGFREIALKVFNAGTHVFTYQIFHIWKLEEMSCASLYFLAAPEILAGTAVKMVERPNHSDMELWLHFRTTREAIRVDPSKCEQFVLGTDFTYSDLRFWLPTDTLEFKNIRFKGIPLPQECILDATSKRQNGHYVEMRLTLDATHWFPLAIEWRDPAFADPRRLYLASNLISVHGVCTPQVISVSRPREGYTSEMTLRRAIHGTTIESAMLQPENLAHLSKADFEPWASRAIELCGS
jgi:hypothetical protein